MHILTVTVTVTVTMTVIVTVTVTLDSRRHNTAYLSDSVVDGGIRECVCLHWYQLGHMFTLVSIGSYATLASIGSYVYIGINWVYVNAYVYIGINGVFVP